VITVAVPSVVISALRPSFAIRSPLIQPTNAPIRMPPEAATQSGAEYLDRSDAVAIDDSPRTAPIERSKCPQISGMIAARLMIASTA
jgi:hypothetical protein